MHQQMPELPAGFFLSHWAYVSQGHQLLPPPGLQHLEPRSLENQKSFVNVNLATNARQTAKDIVLKKGKSPLNIKLLEVL